MDLTTLFGLVASLAIIITSVGFENIFDLFTDLVALKIVIGVSLSVIFINKPLKELLNIIYIVKELLFTRETNLKKVVPTFLKLSSQSRKNGILSLESSIEGIENKFLAKGLQFSIDGLEPETIRDIMNTELRYLKHRHQSGADIFTSLGNISIRIGWL
jgi:chemotaxis protein MotA